MYEYKSIFEYVHWHSLELWHASLEVHMRSCEGVWSLIGEFEFCPPSDKKFALKRSNFNRESGTDFKMPSKKQYATKLSSIRLIV